MVLIAAVIGCEPRVADQLRMAYRPAVTFPQVFVPGTDDNVAVPAGEGLEGSDRGVAVADRTGHLAGSRVTNDGILQKGHLAVEHRDVDPVAVPALLPGQKSAENADGQVKTRRQIP